MSRGKFLLWLIGCQSAIEHGRQSKVAIPGVTGMFAFSFPQVKPSSLAKPTAPP